MTVDQVAWETGISSKRISSFETGERRPIGTALTLLALIYDKPIAWLRAADHLALRLRQARREANMTEAMAADSTGLALDTILEYESEVRAPITHRLKLLAQAYGKPVE
jgi:DNA-binding transcriptional regulator YiaG